MKIAIIGVGAFGSVLAGYLKKGGADLYLVDLNRTHMDKIAKDGLRFKTLTDETVLTGFHTAYSADDIGIMDAVILLVKATQTEAALSGATACIGENTVIIPLHNGLGNDARAAKFVPEDRIIFGCGNIGTELPEPGMCVAKPVAGTNLFIGPMKKSARCDEIGAYLVECLTAGGLTPEYCDDVRPLVWRKAVSNIANNAVCPIVRLRIGEVQADEYASKLYWSVVKEADQIAQKLGIKGLYEYIEESTPNKLKSIGHYYPSMAQDILMFKRQTEVIAMTGALSDYGKEFGIPTPTCDVLTLIIKAIQGNYAIQYKENA